MALNWEVLIIPSEASPLGPQVVFEVLILRIYKGQPVISNSQQFAGRSALNGTSPEGPSVTQIKKKWSV